MKCPNCGAVLPENGKCEYCGYIVKPLRDIIPSVGIVGIEHNAIKVCGAFRVENEMMIKAPMEYLKAQTIKKLVEYVEQYVQWDVTDDFKTGSKLIKATLLVAPR